MAVKAKEAGFKELFLPAANAREGAVIQGLTVYPVNDVQQLVGHLTGKKPISPERPGPREHIVEDMPDFADVRGQYEVKRALEIAASGGHSVILVGTPGSGKSMMAKRIPSILPEMTFEEALETTMIHSIAGKLPEGSALLSSRPFRAPHHTISPAGLSGGGSSPKPGEISLAHNGVLFLDELPEFTRPAMEILRQPMEDGVVTISRVGGNAAFPCRFMLVAAMNPCPCGYHGHPTRPCTCSPRAVERYQSRISGPLMERIDLHVQVLPVEFQQLSGKNTAESSAQIRKRVNTARQLQVERYTGLGYSCNAGIPSSQLEETVKATHEAQSLLEAAFDRFGFSARSYTRVLRVARTIADLERSENVQADHVAEAVQYRTLDRRL